MKRRRFRSWKSFAISMLWILASLPYWLVCGDPAVDWMEARLKKHAYWEKS